MYGTTIRNYNNFNRSTREDINTRSFFGKSKKNKKVKKEETKRTRYMKIDENVSRESETTKTNIVERISRKEFPIASVILTVVATMIILLIGTGVIG